MSACNWHHDIEPLAEIIIIIASLQEYIAAEGERKERKTTQRYGAQVKMYSNEPKTAIAW